MEVVRDLLELQELVSQLGLTDDKRDSPRYKVSIPGNYYVEEEGQLESLYTCRLVDVKSTKLRFSWEIQCIYNSQSGRILQRLLER
jgi:hypothetical protein